MFTLISLILVIIGSLNWFSIGAFNFNIVGWIFGAGSVVSAIIYCLVGIAALWLIYVAIFRRDVINFNNDLKKMKKM